MQITQVFALRLVILTLAALVIGLFTLVALVDGLVQRDLRRWGGGRESSFVYHYAKKSHYTTNHHGLGGVPGLALQSPPVVDISAFCVGIFLCGHHTASSFKKYL